MVVHLFGRQASIHCDEKFDERADALGAAAASDAGMFHAGSSQGEKIRVFGDDDPLLAPRENDVR